VRGGVSAAPGIIGGDEVVDPYVIGITGASGAPLAKRAIQELLARSIPVAVTCSRHAGQVWQEELGEPLESALDRFRRDPNFRFYEADDVAAPISSGTYATGGMLIVPASMSTIACIAHGVATNLLQRAADVTLKERRRLVLVPRETPLSPIHLENMLTLARLGTVVLPPVPAFYLHPRSVDDIVEFVVSRALLALGVKDALRERLRYKRGEAPAPP